MKAQKLLSDIIDFKSVILLEWMNDLYTNDVELVSKEETFDLCLDSYLRGVADAVNIIEEPEETRGITNDNERTIK
jgi:hypothetical protein